MKSISSPLRGHLDLTVTTLATIWRITRMDEQEFFFTDHDVDLFFDGNWYRADKGYSRSSIMNNATLSVDNLDVLGIFDSDEIKDEDIRAGLFDYAEIRVSLVNWADLSQGELKARRGHLGECILSPQGWFKAELRGLTQNLAQYIGQVYQAECRADLGDSKCRVPIRPPLWTAVTLKEEGDYIRVILDTGITDLISGEPLQEAYQNKVFRCVSPGYTSPTEPTFDDTVGEETPEIGQPAFNLLNFTGNPSNNQTFTVDGKVYRLLDTLSDTDGYIQRGANLTDTIANIMAALTLGAGAGTLYAASTTAHTTVTFSLNSSTSIRCEAITPGAAGNLIVTTETLSFASFSNGLLQGGVDGAVWVAEESWTRHAEVTSVISQDVFEISVDESRAANDWFNGGGLIFESGNNAGFAVEIRSWTASNSRVTLFLDAPYPIQVGDALRLYPGCDKRLPTCVSRFNNVLNFRGEPFVPGQDEVSSYPDAQ